jgi:hypothetical protein
MVDWVWVFGFKVAFFASVPSLPTPDCTKTSKLKERKNKRKSIRAEAGLYRPEMGQLVEPPRR